MLYIISGILSKAIPSEHYLTIAFSLFAIVLVHGWSAGRKTTRDRDLHGRVILLTGAYTPIGLTLLTSLAQRGAQVIAIVPSLADPALLSIIDLIRYTHKNDLVYAEACDFSSPGSIKDFTAKLIKSTGGGVAGEFRLDAIIFAHEYGHIGGWKYKNREEETRRREEGLLATFFLTTLLLPVLLTAPSDRDVRIINLVNPFYSAAVPQFDPSAPTQQPDASTSIWREEGRRSLRSILFTRHLQRVLDALPAGARAIPVVSGDAATTNTPKKISNITAVTASPGISRADTIAPFWRADASLPSFSVVGSIIYIFLFPLLWLFTKSASAAMQTTLHALFLPTSWKAAPPPAPIDGTQPKLAPKREGGGIEECIQGGQLYAECKVVQLPEQGEYALGGEEVGRIVWEGLESGLEAWKKEEERRKTREGMGPKR